MFSYTNEVTSGPLLKTKVLMKTTFKHAMKHGPHLDLFGQRDPLFFIIFIIYIRFILPGPPLPVVEALNHALAPKQELLLLTGAASRTTWGCWLSPTI